MTLSDQYQSRYVRRLGDDVLSHAGTTLGVNVDYPLFNDDFKVFACEWDDIDYPPTAGQAISPRGEVISYDLPVIPPRLVALRIHDWDMDLKTKLEEWKFGATVLRWWVPGSHFVVCQISKIKMTRPLKPQLEVELLVRGIFYYDTDEIEVIERCFLISNELLNEGRAIGEVQPNA